METFVKLTLIVLVAVGVFFAIGALFAWPVFLIWNWMMPGLFGLPTITFWQAFWGPIMAKLIFAGGFSTKGK